MPRAVARSRRRTRAMAGRPPTAHERRRATRPPELTLVLPLAPFIIRAQRRLAGLDGEGKIVRRRSISVAGEVLTVGRRGGARLAKPFLWANRKFYTTCRSALRARAKSRDTVIWVTPISLAISVWDSPYWQLNLTSIGWRPGSRSTSRHSSLRSTSSAGDGCPSAHAATACALSATKTGGGSPPRSYCARRPLRSRMPRRIAPSIVFDA